METKYPTLRRPKKKLCYPTTKQSAPQQWALLSLGDVDKMFDDLDPTLNGDEDVYVDVLPTSPLLHMSETEINQSEGEDPLEPQEEQLTEKPPICQVGAEGDVLHPAAKSPSPALDIEKPVKTSSPIEENMAVQGIKELDNEKGRAVSPILFDSEDEEKEEAKTEPPATQKPKCSPSISKEFEMESPPSRVALSKPTMSSHKNKVEGSCNKSHPVKEKSSKKPEIPVLEGKGKPRQENTEPPTSSVRQEAEVAAPKKKSEIVHRQPSLEVSSRVDRTNFLQKLREAAQPKPACTRKPPSPVKVPTPPEPEDDFLILEDETPLWFSIPSKTAAIKRQKTPSTDKDSSPDMRLKHSSGDTAQKQQESKLGNVKPGGQTVQKTKKMKGKEKKNEATEPGNDVDELCSPEELPAGELMEQEKPNKKKQGLKKVPSKESDKAEEQPKDTASRETDEATLKMEKKSQKSSDMKRSKSLKDGNENAKTSRVKSLKGARKETQGSGAVKERRKSSEEHADAEDLDSLSAKQVMNSEDCQIPVKRKRQQTGEWWLCRPEKTEETKVTDKQPTPKKSKQPSKKPSEEVPSPVKTKKDRVLKRGSQTKCAPSSSQKTNKASERKNKQNKSRRGTPGKTKASEEIFDVIVEEQIDEQEQLEDLDPVDSSPLVLVHRDHSLDSGSQVFQRVYCHSSNEKLSITPTPASPRGSPERLRPAQSEKRKRKPPSNWWMVDGILRDVENINSQPQQEEPKPRKERKKQSKQSRSAGLGTPKNGNVVDSFRPLGEAPVPSLKVKPLSPPKTVKRSLATFKNIFASAAETPTVVGSSEAGQNNRLKVTACPAVEVTVTDGNTEEAILSMNVGESNDLPNQEGQQDSNFQSENTLKVLRSGPSSMIELEHYAENEDLILPSSKIHAVMSPSDLCRPPLKPMILQPKDKANLTEWFQSLWSSTVNNGAEITPDQFDWYFYQGRAFGLQVDLNQGSICNGKILLGSYMKKPLWVDHSATAVFNVLTSSVSVIIDTRESRFNPGQSFMVPHGHAYSIQNVCALPAVLYFTRVLAESSD
ncbi:nucleolar and coiled-body phosphoprotein 1 isoform X1 [Larimichthys crocea]|uniref:nucleolar and coiled-body phosphoprotein 1 isoform X1 n=1 Tax=Larimichthys crocea TaxID=215358 RepID=UPI000F5F0DD4|nr:nucleolar and coiled-body phosphoprotein 1 isoform X1 [Larimichthys crocea]